MHPTKQLLIERNGLKCMLCGQEKPYNEIEWHHIKPKAVCKYLDEPIDDTYENGALLCKDCHSLVHTIYYWDKRYDNLMRAIRKNKR